LHQYWCIRQYNWAENEPVTSGLACDCSIGPHFSRCLLFPLECVALLFRIISQSLAPTNSGNHRHRESGNALILFSNSR
jgi:hypothetical protein